MQVSSSDAGESAASDTPGRAEDFDFGFYRNPFNSEEREKRDVAGVGVRGKRAKGAWGSTWLVACWACRGHCGV